ncbi:MAG: glycosyltransferase family 2 protein [Anaerolineaceae bacterium]|nr:glycosyltransferase family 2 protein [Anaerolineaceae bacterium]
MVITGLMRIKNEARWIGRCLSSLFPLCERVVVFDDHSTDNTREICAAIPNVTVLESPFEGLDEARDKNWLLDQVRETTEWVFMHDGDEVLAPGSAEIIRNAIQAHSAIDCFSLRLRYLWNSETQERVDGVYVHAQRACIFRPGDYRFQDTSFGGNFHCGNAPLELQQQTISLDASLLHLGYLGREDRIRKYQWYNEKDPGNMFEDYYRHTVIGDLFPANSKFKWGGPIELKELIL